MGLCDRKSGDRLLVKLGSPSFGTKTVVMIEAIERSEGFDKSF